MYSKNILHAQEQQIYDEVNYLNIHAKRFLDYFLRKRKGKNYSSDFVLSQESRVSLILLIQTISRINLLSISLYSQYLFFPYFPLFSSVQQAAVAKTINVRRAQTGFLLNLKTLVRLFLLYLQNSSQSFWGLEETLLVSGCKKKKIDLHRCISWCN